MPDPERFLAFDGASDEVTVVLASRQPGDTNWHIDGICDREGHVVTTVTPPVPLPTPAGREPGVTWPGAVAKWMDKAKAGGLTLELTTEQRDLLARTFERLLAEGHLTFKH